MKYRILINYEKTEFHVFDKKGAGISMNNELTSHDDPEWDEVQAARDYLKVLPKDTTKVEILYHDTYLIEDLKKVANRI